MMPSVLFNKGEENAGPRGFLVIGGTLDASMTEPVFRPAMYG